MHIDRAITCVNENPLYLEFAESFVRNWTSEGFRVTIAYIGEELPECAKHTVTGCEWLLYKPVQGVNTGVQAKFTRGIVAYEHYPNDVCTIADIDQYILNFITIKNKIEKCSSDKICTIGKNLYDLNDDKFPMCYTTFVGKQIKCVLNPNNLEYRELINSLMNIKDPIDNKEHLSTEVKNSDLDKLDGGSTGKFSDESLWRYLIRKTNTQHMFEHYYRDDVISGRCIRKIDRIYDVYFQNKLTLNIQGIENGHYIDVQPPRPYSKYKSYIETILSK